MKQILTSLVGSRLHNLHTEKSDYDYRGIFMNDLKDIISPYKKEKNRHWIEGDEDNTSYEFRDFCKFATQGNMTILEVMWSDKVKEASSVGDYLIANKTKFSDSTRIFEASRGYASNQLKKMNLFDINQRSAKFAASYIRVMYQGAVMLRTGELPCNVDPYRDFILKIKENFTDKDAIEAAKIFNELEKDIVLALETSTTMTPDLDWIEQFLYEAYTA